MLTLVRKKNIDPNLNIFAKPINKGIVGVVKSLSPTSMKSEDLASDHNDTIKMSE